MPGGIAKFNLPGYLLQQYLTSPAPEEEVDTRTFEEKYGISSQEPFVRAPTEWEQKTARTQGGVREALEDARRKAIFPFTNPWGDQPTVAGLEKTGVIPEIARVVRTPAEELSLIHI